jgi:hypothetical protein
MTTTIWGASGGAVGASSAVLGPYPIEPDMAALSVRTGAVREEVVVTDIGDGTSHLFIRVLAAHGVFSWLDLGIIGPPAALNSDPMMWADGDGMLWPDGDTMVW